MGATYLGLRHSFDGIRVYRSGAATTGADGVAVPVDWDAESPFIVKANVDHSTVTDPSEITMAVAWRYCVTLAVRVEATVGLTSAEAEVQIDDGGGWQTAASDRQEGAGPLTLKVTDFLDLAEGTKVRFQVKSIGTAGASLGTGEAVTYATIAAV